jgi:radical S-adenosyl methionine domain-containing protein 2
MSAILNNRLSSNYRLLETIVINYHLTEKCNYSCRHCFAKYNLDQFYKQELHHDIKKTQNLLESIYNYFHKDLGIKNVRLNFAGGEPMLSKNFEKLILIAKEIGFELSLITNGSMLTQKFITKYINHFSMIGVSIDSFDEETNSQIGRISNNAKILDFPHLRTLLLLARQINPKLNIKINTVITEHNVKEEMTKGINSINPTKWKIFKVIPCYGTKALSDKEFNTFINRHKSEVASPIYIEENDDMKESYIMIDPLGRFYQNKMDMFDYTYSTSILDIGAKEAFAQIAFDIDKFSSRYNGTKIADENNR